MYIPHEPALVLHVLTSWQSASQSVTSTNASADSNGQSPVQKMNALCQRYFAYDPAYGAKCSSFRQIQITKCFDTMVVDN